jgi:diguanylate cyclase (GGDEF)-like protein
MSSSSGEVSSERRSLLESTIQTLPVGVVVHDGQGRCILANAAARECAAALTLDVAELGANVSVSHPEVLRVDGHDLEVHGRALRTGGEDYRLTTIVDVTRQHALQRSLVERAYLDALTGLPNRALFEQTVADLIASCDAGRGRFALAFIDLDNFKNINDYYSHATGDALLIKVADRIRTQLGGSDMLARVGGDEFMLMLAPVDTCESAFAIVGSIAERLKQPFFIDGHEIFASASIGLSVHPDHGESYDVLRRRADNAMYRVKGGVKGGVRIFEDSMLEAATARMAVEQRLRLAVRDRCFCCAYQPKVDLRSGEVTGVEVLLRWRDQQGLIQAPGDLIGLAVELGLINDITFHVLAETVRTIPDLDERYGAEVTLSLNVAAKQACDIQFMSALCDAIAASGHAERFILELTEEAFFTKGSFQREVLPRIRAAGARVSIDDFGVGYSSLAALAEITADELKIDRSFITDIHKRPRSQLVLKAIESLARSLGMTIIAEGVETVEEAAYLQAATQIRYAQGYYFARPMLIEEILGSDRMIRPQRESLHPRRLAEARRHPRRQQA